MRRQLILRIAIRFFLLAGLIVLFMAGYNRVRENVESQDEALGGNVPASTARTARYLNDDATVHFESVAKLEMPEKPESARRTDIAIDAFGEAYVSGDGSDIAIGDPGHVYSERGPVWTAASGESRLYYAMPREGRLVVAQSLDGGRTFQSERTIVNGFRNETAAVQGNLALLNGSSGTKLYNVFLSNARNEVQIARCTDPCRRFTTRSVYAASADRTFDHPNPYVAVDRAGGLHVTFSDGHDVFLTSSADDGETFKEPVRVNAPGPDEPAISPFVVAGDSGRVSIVWQQGKHLFSAVATDAFSSLPSFHSTLVSEDANPAVTASAAIHPTGALWIAYRAEKDLVVLRQTSGEGLIASALWATQGDLRDENSVRRLNVNVRQDLTGQLNYFDEAFHIFLKADRFKVSTRDDKQIAISGTGRLQNGTDVSFTLLAPQEPEGKGEISISMTNGYFAAGVLAPARQLERNLHIVGQGGNALKVPR